MLRVLLKMMLMAWIASVLLLLAMLNFGKTAPEISTIAFFSQEINGTDYWRVDLFTGVAFKSEYMGRLVMPDYGQSPVEHFLLLDSDSDFSEISELNPQTQELSFVGTYWTRHNRLSMAGDSVFLMDYANHWTWIDILNPELKDFGDYPNLSNLRVSPDGGWLAGAFNSNWTFINLLDGSSYAIENYFRIYWSPDSQWYIADNSESFSVLSAASGSPHPNLPLNISAYYPAWSSDGQSIFYRADGHLASISLADGQVSEYPLSLDWYNPECIAPNDAYFLLSDGNFEKLLAIETGEIIWQIEGEFAVAPVCLWSEDSRYLISYYTIYDYGVNSAKDEWERFFVIDTLSGVSWDLYPELLPSLPIYPHFSD